MTEDTLTHAQVQAAYTALTAPTTPKRRNRGGSPKQYQDLHRKTISLTAELDDRLERIPGDSSHERIRALVEFWEQAHTEGTR